MGDLTPKVFIYGGVSIMGGQIGQVRGVEQSFHFLRKYFVEYNLFQCAEHFRLEKWTKTFEKNLLHWQIKQFSL